MSATARLADGLGFAATPGFIAMAILTATSGAPAEFCAPAGSGWTSLGGMASMYALMALVHAGPWLRSAPSLWRAETARRPTA